MTPTSTNVEFFEQFHNGANAPAVRMLIAIALPAGKRAKTIARVLTDAGHRCSLTMARKIVMSGRIGPRFRPALHAWLIDRIRDDPEAMELLSTLVGHMIATCPQHIREIAINRLCSGTTGDAKAAVRYARRLALDLPGINQIGRRRDRDVYAEDVPSRAMARWLVQADANRELPYLDREGHAVPIRVKRACEYRGWVCWIGSDTDEAARRWFLTVKGSAALDRAAQKYGIDANLADPRVRIALTTLGT